MKIIPLSEIRNTAAVSKLVIENSPVLVTKQWGGGEHIVMLSHEMYENVKRENTELKEYVKVLEADLEIMKNGKNLKSFDEFMENLKNV